MVSSLDLRGTLSTSWGSITLQVCIRFSTTTVALTLVLKLYGIYRSPWVRLVAARLYEKQVPFVLVSHKAPLQSNSLHCM